MSRQRVIVERQAITGKDRQTTRGQALGDVMNQLMSEVLSPRAEGEGGDQLGGGVAGDPQPFGFNMAIKFQTNFIELDMS